MTEPTGPNHGGKLSGALFTECAEWIWEQLQEEDGMYMAGELVELILSTERELDVHAEPTDRIVRVVTDELAVRGITANPSPVSEDMVRAVVEWEDEFLGLAAIPRHES